MCGEKEAPLTQERVHVGSPPRMRGKASALDVLPLPCGITPAYAGKSSEDTRRSGTNGDHPRVCGEKSFENGVKGYFEGSPPRMRGKAQGQVMAGFAFGITPAHAGKRRSIGRLSQPTRDHPRVCGEKCSSVRSASHRRGSPPRMRGKDLPFTCDCESTGITPACAGKSSSR